MNNKSLFIINSPFQALCAIEAISYYGEKEPYFLLFNCDDSREKIEKLLVNNGLTYDVLPFTGTKDLIKSARKIKKYKRLYIGDYFSYDQYFIGVLKATRYAQIIFLDDGASTLTLLPNIGRKRYSGFSKRTVSYLTLDILAYVKHVRKFFYSIFDISSCVKIPVDKNCFPSLSSKLSNSPQNGIYVIGTNSSVLPFKDVSYDVLLKRLSEYLKLKYPNDSVFYCPHRRDTNDYKGLIEELDFEFFHTDISVEVDFVLKKISPKLIVGFGSTALMTLKSIFKSNKVATVHLHLADTQLETTYRSIEDYYSCYGIEILDL